MATEGKVASSNTGVLNDRLTTVEERVQFNNDSLKEMYNAIEKLDIEAKDMEDELAAWMERELAKVYDIINDNPLGQ